MERRISHHTTLLSFLFSSLVCVACAVCVRVLVCLLRCWLPLPPYRLVILAEQVRKAGKVNNRYAVPDTTEPEPEEPPPPFYICVCCSYIYCISKQHPENVDFHEPTAPAKPDRTPLYNVAKKVEKNLKKYENSA